MRFNHIKKPLLTIILLYPLLANAEVSSEFKDVIIRYYSIPKMAKSVDWSHEAEAKAQLMDIFNKIFTTPKIDHLKQWVQNTSTQSSFYSIVLDEIEPIGNIGWVSSSSLSKNKHKVIVQRVKKSVLWESNGFPGFKAFIEQHKITTHTPQDLEALQSKTKTPDLIEYVVFSKIKEEFLLVNTGREILISNIKQVDLISSTLEISMP